MIVGGVWPLVDVATMRALDRHTIEALGVPSEILMESAGRAAAQLVLEQLRDGSSSEVCVVCGVGNNGGDGLVLARHLQLLGVDVRAALIGDDSRLSADTAANLERARRAGVRVEREGWRASEGGVVVDALFGTGLTRPVTGVAADAIQTINQARAGARARPIVMAIDLPSGLDADTGQVLGTAVRADVTATVGLPKLGLVLEPGRSLAGRVHVLRIGIADEAPNVRPPAELWSARAAGARLPERPRQGHKGTFGHVLLVAGGEGKTGAAALAALAAARVGAGLVTIACPAGLNDILEVKCTEAMTAALPDTPERALAAAAEDAVLALAAERDVVAMGPGVGRSHETVCLMRALAKRLEVPLVVDADGLFAFAEEPGTLKARGAVTILTPHPGEAARLLGTSSADVNRDRISAARALAAATGAVVLLKGAASITASPDGRVIVNPTGGPALAAGGSGDVLAGMVAAYLGQGLVAVEAAALAAYVHGAAADRLGHRAGGLLASELADGLPAAAEWLRALRASDGPRVAEAGVGLALPLPGS